MKWFDARILSEANAELLLIREWIAVLDWGLKHSGLDHCEDAKGNKLSRPFVYSGATLEYFQSVNGGEDYSAFLKMKRVCDMHCIPYRLFCEVAMNTILGMDRVSLDVREIPSLMIMSSIMEAVRERVSAGAIFYASSEYFQPSNYISTPNRFTLQDEYTEYIIRRVKDRYRGAKIAEVVSKMVDSGKLHAESVEKSGFTLPSQEKH